MSGLPRQGCRASYCFFRALALGLARFLTLFLGLALGLAFFFGGFRPLWVAQDLVPATALFLHRVPAAVFAVQRVLLTAFFLATFLATLLFAVFLLVVFAFLRRVALAICAPPLRVGVG